MEYLDLINQQSEDISTLYDILGDVVDNIESNTNHKLIKHTNENVIVINDRLNRMDMDIENNNNSQSRNQKRLTNKIDKTIKDNNKKNGLYKTELTKKLNKVKRELKLDEDIQLLSIDKRSNVKDILYIKELEEKLNKVSMDFNNYKKEMDKIHISLRKEMRITRNIINQYGTARTKYFNSK